jgi:hypothetical protein
MSAYEGEHTIFGLLVQANLAQNDVRSKLLWLLLVEKRLELCARALWDVCIYSYNAKTSLLLR